MKFIYYDSDANSYHVWNNSTSNIFEKPIILIEGFDPKNENNPSQYFKIGNEIISKLLALNKEVIVVNFGNGGQDIANNATAFKAILNDINAKKIGTEPTMVIGLSMGGVIGRMALVQMENANQVHDVSHFISVDSPQNGAIIHDEFIDYIKEKDSGNISLNSVASKQLLKFTPFDSHTQTNTSMHNIFYNNLKNLNSNKGYPINTVNIGVAFSNPNIEQPIGEWLFLDVDLGSWFDKHFIINQNDDVSEPGSKLPIMSSSIYTAPGFFGWGGPANTAFSYRLGNTNPTFIPHKSALDINANGVSAFGLNVIYPNTNYFHDEFPHELVSPLLEKIGLFKTISVNSTLQTTQLNHAYIEVKPNVILNLTGVGTLSNKTFIMGNNSKLVIANNISFSNVIFQSENDISNNYSVELVSNATFRVPASGNVTFQGRPSFTGYRLNIDQGGELEIKDGTEATFSDSFQFHNYGTLRVGEGVNLNLRYQHNYAGSTTLINLGKGSQSFYNLSANGSVYFNGAATIKNTTFAKQSSSNFYQIQVTDSAARSFENVHIEGSQYGFQVSTVPSGKVSFKNLTGNANYYGTLKGTNAYFEVDGFNGTNAIQDGMGAYTNSSISLNGQIRASGNLVGIRSCYTSQIQVIEDGYLDLTNNTHGIHVYQTGKLLALTFGTMKNTVVDNTLSSTTYPTIQPYNIFSASNSVVSIRNATAVMDTTELSFFSTLFRDGGTIKIDLAREYGGGRSLNTTQIRENLRDKSEKTVSNRRRN